MTTLSAISSQTGGSTATSEIASLNKQITAIMNQLKSLGSDHTMTTEQKAEKQQLLESQIQMIYARIAQIQQREAETAQQQEDTGPAAIKADGINRPTDVNQLNVYI